MHHETNLTNICTCGDNIHECGHAPRSEAVARPGPTGKPGPKIAGDVRDGRRLGTLAVTLTDTTRENGLRAVAALENAGWTADQYRGTITITSSPKGKVGALQPDFEIHKAAVRAILEAA